MNDPAVSVTMMEFSPAWERALRIVGGLGTGDVEPFAGLTERGWTELLEQCNQHWVTPAVYRTLLLNRDRVGVPPDVWRGFKKMYRLSMARTRRANAVICPVLAAFEAERIPVIALKGLHLSTEVYDTPHARPMIDADLLLQPEHIASAVRIIGSFGFRQRDGDAASARRDIAQRPRLHHLPIFWYPNGPPIEIHEYLVGPDALPRVPVEDLWQRVRPLRIGPTNVLGLAPEDALLHLCIHAADHHAFAVKLLSLCDVVMAVERWRGCIDWQAFWLRASDWDVERSVRLVFTLTRDRLGYSLPGALAERLPPDDLADLMRCAEQQMRLKAATLAKRHLVVAHKSGYDVLIRLKRAPGLRARARLLARRVLIPRRELAGMFGLVSEPFWLPLLYPVRFVTLCMKHLPGMFGFGLLRRDEQQQQEAAIDAQRELWEMGNALQAGLVKLRAWLHEA